MSAGQEGIGRVPAAIGSLLVPGLGQLLQRRPWIALVMIALAGVLWIIRMGWIIHLWSCLDAAIYKRPE
ncbi:hypothetical protein [Dyella sedimenti]|uniref:hypothetical protein n=1 Tax=Dyella sedimenti TaxID=2919947 RepID=UPI001FAB28D6|nr:hypothetical protein [Dyella sedimenti]